MLSPSSSSYSYHPRWLLLSSSSSSNTTTTDGREEWMLALAFGLVTLQLIRAAMALIQYVTVLQEKNAVAAERRPSPPSNTTTELTRPLLLLEGESNEDSGDNDDDDHNEPTTEHTPFRKVILTLLWLALATYFIYSAASSNNKQFQSLLIATAVLIAFEMGFVWTTTTVTTGAVHRCLQLTVGGLTWISYLVLALRIHGIAATILLIVFLLAPHATPPAKQGPDDSTSTHTPPQFLSWDARWQLVKPYVWPDEAEPSSSASSSFCLGSNRVRAISTWLCVIGSKLATIIAPVFLGQATTALAHQDYRLTIVYAVAYCVVSWLGTTLKEVQSLLYLKVAQAAFCQLATHAFGHLHALSLDWHLRKQLGQVLRSMDRGIAACDTLMKYLFLWLVPAFCECLAVSAIFAIYFSYVELGIVMFYFVFVYVVWTIVVTIWRKQYRKALTRSDNKWHDTMTDSLVNFETVKCFTAEQHELDQFRAAVSHYQAGSVNVQGSLSFLNISQQIILKTCLAVALSLAAHAIHVRVDCCLQIAQCASAVSDCCRDTPLCREGMRLGDFVTVLSYTLSLFTPLNYLGSVYNAVVMAVIDLANMTELLAENPDVVDAPDALELPTVEDDEDDIAIEFDNVFFHYPTQPEERGLKGLSFQMKRGTTTAIVGPTGAGKTTVSRLLFRFYDVLGGAVKVNGKDVRSITQTSLRAAIGVVPQAASMFNDTIRTNILYGKQDASEEELRQAATDAQILSFIESLDDGWETLVGDRGLKLSGGEKQRTAIARCLLKNPPFVLLDEATSALDTLTESSVQEALDRLGKERTVLVIAHRLGTIRNADNIVVLKDGRVAEQGTHDDLVARNGVYADMWNMQLHASSATSSKVGLATSSDQ